MWAGFDILKNDICSLKKTVEHCNLKFSFLHSYCCEWSAVTASLYFRNLQLLPAILYQMSISTPNLGVEINLSNHNTSFSLQKVNVSACTRCLGSKCGNCSSSRQPTHGSRTSQKHHQTLSRAPALASNNALLYPVSTPTFFFKYVSDDRIHVILSSSQVISWRYHPGNMIPANARLLKSSWKLYHKLNQASWVEMSR